jgi:predicted MFS family arabinose efflux permease
LRANADFRKLWLGQSISFLGSEITEVALPLVAVLLLRATPSQMGWMTAARHLPMVLLGLVAGVWIDRWRRRPVLVASDFASAAFLATIPLAALLGVLSMPLLYSVAFATGGFHVVAAVADRAYLPSLLPREDLVPGNSRIWFSASLARTAGPGLAGLLVQWLTAPVAIVVDVLSFVAGGLLVGSIRHVEPRPEADARPILPAVREGLRRVAKSPLLRPLVLCGATHNLCSTMIVAVYVLYLTRHLGVTPPMLGLILLGGGIGSLAGSLLAWRASRRLGIGPTLIVAQALTGVARLAVPLAAGPRASVVALLFGSELLLGAARSTFNITQISLRQAITPSEVQGRVNASVGFLLWVLTPIGALAGGYLGAEIGLRATLWLAAGGVTASTLLALFSRLATTRDPVAM